MKIRLMLSILCLTLFFTSIGGVYATWKYAEQSIDDVQTEQNVTLSHFIWEPEEILPTVTPGQNFLDLLNSILNNVKNGLNSSKDALEKAVVNKGLLHSSHNLQGGNIKHLFINEECRELDFLFQYISDTEFHLYMYKESDVKTGAVGVSEIAVYMSILVKENSVWKGKEAQFGYAKIQYLPNSSIIAVDVSSWYR